MHDRRVVRGNTFSAQIPTLSQRKVMEQKAEDLRRKAQELQRKMQNKTTKVLEADSEPSARQNTVVQTEDYLEDLADAIGEQDMSVQTEATEDAPVLPVFRARERGTDKGTWIEEGELFDFSIAVEPILEVLVGKCLDQSLTEVLEEEELQMLERQRATFEQKRNVAMTEAQRLEAECKRQHEEKERRLAQARQRLIAERAMGSKISAASTARSYLAGLQSSVLQRLQEEGLFFDPVVKEVEYIFLPWLMDKVDSHLRDVRAARHEADEILEAALQRLQATAEDKKKREQDELMERERLRKEAEVARLAKLEMEEAERRARLAAQQKQEDDSENAEAEVVEDD